MSPPGTSPWPRLQALCRHPRVPVIVALLAVLLATPALFVGYQADDYVQQAILNGVEPVEGPQRDPVMDLFAFFDGDEDRNGRLRDAGVSPWWADLSLRARLWRPVTAVTHVVDHALAPGNSVFAHAHSLGWLFLLCLLAAHLFRVVHGPGLVAGLAALMYAVDETHGMPVGWLANRNALVAGVFGLASLLLFVRARRQGSRGAYVASLGVFALALLAAEAGLATTAWLFAWVVCMEPDARWRTRLGALAPYAVVVVVWRLVYSLLGYGVDGSGLYLDPVRSPLRYLAALPGRGVLLLADQLVNFPAMLAAMAPGTVRVAITVALIPVVGLAVRGLWRRLDDLPEVRFWVVGALLSLLPVAATFPMGRVLGFVGLGGAALLAMVVAAAWARGANALQAPGGGDRWASAILVLHVGVAAATLPIQSYVTRPMTDLLFNPCDVALDGRPLEGRTVVIVNSNDLCGTFVAYRRAVDGRPQPAAVRLLASALYDVEIEGIDAHTLEVRIPAGMQSTDADGILRSVDDPLPVGKVIDLPGTTYEVVGWNARGLVDRVRVRFDAPLRDESLIWLCTRDRAPAEFVPPAPGEVVALPKAF